MDDHPIIRSGLRYLIGQERDLEVCGEADSVHSAMVRFDEVQPDLVLLDLTLQDGTGWDVMKHLRQHWLGARILIVSSWDRFNASSTMVAGAMGFISKYDANDRLIEAIRTVLNGQTYLTAKPAARAARRMD